MRWLKLPLLALALSLQACGGGDDTASAPQPDGEGYTHTVTLPTEYYEKGPQQASPPDGQLAPGTRLRVVEEAGSYVLVEAEGGIRGYISAGSYAPIGALDAPREPLAR